MIKQVKITANDANEKDRLFLKLISNVPNQKQYIMDCVIRCNTENMDRAATQKDVRDAVEELKKFFTSFGQPISDRMLNEELKQAEKPRKKAKKLCDW